MNKPTNCPPTDPPSSQAGLLVFPKTQSQVVVIGGADEAPGFWINSLVSVQGDSRLAGANSSPGSSSRSENEKWGQEGFLCVFWFIIRACSREQHSFPKSVLSEIYAHSIREHLHGCIYSFLFKKYAFVYISTVQKSPKLINSSQLRRCVSAFDSTDS